MDHVLQRIPISSVQRVGTDEKVIILEHTPNAEGLDPFGVIGIHKKIIFHVCLRLLCTVMKISKGPWKSTLTPDLAAAEPP
jgi:hypothetical protein